MEALLTIILIAYIGYWMYTNLHPTFKCPGCGNVFNAPLCSNCGNDSVGVTGRCSKCGHFNLFYCPKCKTKCDGTRNKKMF